MRSRDHDLSFGAIARDFSSLYDCSLRIHPFPLLQHEVKEKS